MLLFGDTVFVLCLGLASLSTIMTERCVYNVGGCDCLPGQVKCVNLEEIPPLSTGTDVTNVSSVTFIMGSFTSVDIHSLPPGLADLEFAFIPLMNISDDAFDNSAKTLTHLQISYCYMSSLPKALLRLTSLRTLRISDTNTDVWDTDILQHIAKTVTDLQLQDVVFLEWPVWFSYFQSLTTAALSLEHFDSLPDDAFNSTSSIEELKLTEWNFTHTPAALSTLKNLTDLQISGTTRNSIDGTLGMDKLALFPLATTLQNLTVSYMGLTEIPDFSYMTHLLKLELHRNNISVFPANRLPLSLEYLSLAYNYVTSVTVDFPLIINLLSLTLSANKISEVNFDMFPKNLVYLDLQSNSINKITGGNSTQYLHLNTLILNYNPIKEISPSAFRDLVNLTKLQMDNTGLTSFPLALTSLEKLSTLSLGDNTLLCSSPPSHEIMAWYHVYGSHISIYANCPNVGRISQYLTFGLPTTTCTTCTSTTILSSKAAALESCLLYGYFCLFLFLSSMVH
ncbi:unnamed protein product [Candidula unifasciata]|uniref:Uncharacterized protein n=1 Tax=Candidula unifasciata TaxID=100452 RepID=A0A8S3YGY4_9EUPU|nr:unnamed protein product [Candidula unifasciata]